MKKAQGTPVVRQVHFDINKDNLPKYYLRGNPFATHLANAYHIVFPEGERFFIRSVKQYADRLKDPELKEKVKAFIGQEVQHGRAHESLWQTLREHDIPVDAYEKFYRESAFEFLEKTLAPFLPEEIYLSITVALEHYTAIMAASAFEENKMGSDHDVPEQLRQLVLWHASEEIEHKAVAFDVLKEVNDSYALRIAGMLLATVALFAYGTMGQTYFLLTDNEFRAMPLWAKINHLSRFLRVQGTTFGKDLLDYFRPDFHPDDHDTARLAEDFLKNFKNYTKNKVA